MPGDSIPEKVVRENLFYAFILIGGAAFLDSIRVSWIVYIVWIFGLVFTSFLLYYRKYLPEVQRILLYFAVFFYTVGTLIYTVALSNEVATFASSITSHVTNGQINMIYVSQFLHAILPYLLAGTALFYSGFSYWLLGFGLYKGGARLYYTLTVIAATVLAESAGVIAIRNEISLISGLGTVSVSSMLSTIRSSINFGNVDTPVVLALSLSSGALMSGLFLLSGWLIRAGKIDLTFSDKTDYGDASSLASVPADDEIDD